MPRALPPSPPPHDDAERPPVGRNWVTLYILVCAHLLCWIVAMALFSRACR
jgi:hypothetical protein